MATIKNTQNTRISFNTTGIEWENVPVILRTDSWVYHNGFKKSNKLDDFPESKSPCILAHQGYYNMGTEIEFVNNEYISIKQYLDNRYVLSRVKNFKEAIIEGERIFASRYIAFCLNKGYEQKFPYIQQQLRIYNDRKVSIVVKVEWKDGVSYFCYRHLSCIYFDRSNTIPETREAGIKYLTNIRGTAYPHRSLNEPDDAEKLHEYYFKQVFTDEDARKCSMYLSKKHPLSNLIEIYETGQFTTEGGSFSQYVNRYRFFPLNSNLAEKFFDVQNPANKLVCDQYKRKENKLAVTIHSLSQLSTFLAIKPSTASTQQKIADANEAIWDKAHWASKEDTMLWERIEDYIFCSYYEVSRYNNIKKQVLFVYNVKTKTRKLLVQDGEGSLSTLIPSCSSLASRLDYDPENVGVEFRGTVKDIFANTNVGWIVDNLDSIGDLIIPEIVITYSNTSALVKQPMKQKFTTFKSNLPLFVLATTGNALLEQLLKTKQFKLYFAILHNIVSNSSHIVPISKEKILDTYDQSHLAMTYDNQAKSLKKMLDMTMSQIQELNNAIDIDMTANTYYSYRVFKLPFISCTKQILGINSFTCLDLPTFTNLLELAKKQQSQYYHPNALLDIIRAGNTAENNPLLAVMSKMSPKDKINFLNKLTTLEGNISYEEYIDYLKMRQKIKCLMEQHIDINIDLSQYPEKPEASVKFLRYVPNAVGLHSTWRRNDTFAAFKEDVKYAYKQNATIEFCESAEGSGALLHLTVAGTIKFLHDELSKWYNLYKNEATNAAFKKAIARVIPLEWEDPDGPLCIVAPRDASDLRNEGKVLSHCVASYIEPIAEGSENIVFIRRKDMKDEPFFTVDVSTKGDIRQIHCYRNGNASQNDIDNAYQASHREVYNIKTDIINFMLKWATAMKGAINKNSIRSRYGALCAERHN